MAGWTREQNEAHNLWMAVNEKMPCVEPGCEALRIGANTRCSPHAHIQMEKRSAIANRAVATRRLRHPHRFIPNSANPNYWRNAASAAVAKAKALGILPDLSTGLYACVDCGKAACQYDHRDYSRPLDVVPVCSSCNCKRGSAEYPSADRFNFKLLNP